MKNTFLTCTGNQNVLSRMTNKVKMGPSGSEGGNKIGLVTRSPNCAAPLSSKLLVSNGSSSLAPLIQQLISPDSLSLQNNLNFSKLTSGKAKKHIAQHAVRVISNQQH